MYSSKCDPVREALAEEFSQSEAYRVLQQDDIALEVDAVEADSDEELRHVQQLKLLYLLLKEM